MTNYEYLVKERPDTVKRIIAYAMDKSDICIDVFSDCFDCPYTIDKANTLCTSKEEVIIDWLGDERDD